MLYIAMGIVSYKTDNNICESETCSVVSYSLQPHGLYSPWNCPSQNTGVGSHSLLQAIFPTQGSNPGLLHHRRILYQLSHQGNPKLACAFTKKKSMHCCWLFSHPVISDSLRLHGLQYSRPPCSSPSPRVYPSSCSLHWWCHPAISSSDTLFSASLNLS